MVKSSFYGLLNQESRQRASWCAGFEQFLGLLTQESRQRASWCAGFEQFLGLLNQESRQRASWCAGFEQFLGLLTQESRQRASWCAYSSQGHYQTGTGRKRNSLLILRLLRGSRPCNKIDRAARQIGRSAIAILTYADRPPLN
jgi:hypothetical protein